MYNTTTNIVVKLTTITKLQVTLLLYEIWLAATTLTANSPAMANDHVVVGVEVVVWSLPPNLHRNWSAVPFPERDALKTRVCPTKKTKSPGWTKTSPVNFQRRYSQWREIYARIGVCIFKSHSTYLLLFRNINNFTKIDFWDARSQQTVDTLLLVILIL